MHILRFTLRATRVMSLVAGLVLLSAATLSWASFPGQNGRIVFVANSGGSWQLYTINADGTDMVQLTNLDATTYDSLAPSFSPDGSKIAFDYGPVDVNGNPHPDLYVINSDGTGLKRLTHDGLSQAPRWSFDGTHLIFARQSPLTGQTVVTLMASDGTGPKTALTSDVWSSFADSYTPDGKINFDSQMGGLVSAEWIMNADGSGQKQLTPAPLEGGVSDVSPDGKHIVLTSHDNSPLPGAIFMMNIDGSQLRQITFPIDGAADEFPAYSPDGTKIVFASSRIDPGSLDLYVMNADGSNITAIATGITVGGCSDGNCVEPSWGPVPDGGSNAQRKAGQTSGATKGDPTASIDLDHTLDPAFPPYGHCIEENGKLTGACGMDVHVGPSGCAAIRSSTCQAGAMAKKPGVMGCCGFITCAKLAVDLATPCSTVR
jgi:TolB protein